MNCDEQVYHSQQCGFNTIICYTHKVQAFSIQAFDMGHNQLTLSFKPFVLANSLKHEELDERSVVEALAYFTRGALDVATVTD